MSNNLDPYADVATTKKEKEKMAENTTESGITVTLKGGTGYDAPWIVIHADDVPHALELLGDEGWDDLVTKTAERAKQLMTAAGGTSSGNSPRRQVNPTATKPSKNTNVECPPGWEYRAGISKTGKPFEGYFPPRGSSEKPIWI